MFICEQVESAIWRVVGFGWLLAFPRDLPHEVASMFVSNLMDLSWCTKSVKFMVGSYLLPSILCFSSLLDALDNYDFNHGSPVIGGFMDQNAIVSNWSQSSLWKCFITSLVRDNPHAFFIHLVGLHPHVGDELYFNALSMFNALHFMYKHALDDPHANMFYLTTSKFASSSRSGTN